MSEAKREIWQSLKRGFACHCPACGEGKLYNAYLKVVPACEQCGEELHHQRADDAPPYFTMAIVAKVVGAAGLRLARLAACRCLGADDDSHVPLAPAPDQGCAGWLSMGPADAWLWPRQRPSGPCLA